MADTIYVNIIDYNLLSHVVFDVKEHIIVNYYIKQRVGPDSLTTTNTHYEKSNGFKVYNEATHICEVCVQWRYRSTYWVVMKDIKDSHPVEFSKYDISVDIQQDPEITGGCPTQ